MRMFPFINFIKQTYRMAQPQERSVVMKNVASLSLLQAITYALPILVLPYLFRVLGPEKFGLIAFAQAFVQYFMILTDYGFNISATKEISICRDEHAQVCRVFSAVMTVKFALSFLSLLILGLILYFIPKFRHDWLVYVLSFGTVVGNTLFPVWFFQGTEKMKHIADLNIAGGVIYAILIFLCINGPEDYLAVPLITSGIFLFTGLLGQYVVFRRFGVAFKFAGYKNIRQQFRAGWDVFIAIAAINAYTTTRVFSVGLLTDNTTTGLYSIAEKIANFFQTFPLSSFSQAIFPRLSHIYHRNRVKAVQLMQGIQQITIMLALIGLPLAFLLAPAIVRIVCGGNYGCTVLALRLLLVSVFFISANAFRIQFLLVCGKTDIYSRIHVVMAIAGLPLIFLLIFSFSFVGAAVATVIIEAGIFILTYATLKILKIA